MPKRVALLTAGGYAPCLSSAVGALIETYDATDPDIELIAYRHGYHGLLTGNSLTIGAEERAGAALLHRFGGSPIGNSRVKLTNDDDCRSRGLIGEGETALEGRPGVIGHDEDRDDEFRAIEFERIAGHKPFDATQAWFTDLLASIGQDAGRD